MSLVSRDITATRCSTPCSKKVMHVSRVRTLLILRGFFTEISLFLHSQCDYAITLMAASSSKGWNQYIDVNFAQELTQLNGIGSACSLVFYTRSLTHENLGFSDLNILYRPICSRPHARTTQRTRVIELMLAQFWPDVVNDGPTLTQHWFNDSNIGAIQRHYSIV